MYHHRLPKSVWISSRKLCNSDTLTLFIFIWSVYKATCISLQFMIMLILNKDKVHTELIKFLISRSCTEYVYSSMLICYIYIYIYVCVCVLCAWQIDTGQLSILGNKIPTTCDKKGIQMSSKFHDEEWFHVFYRRHHGYLTFLRQHESKHLAL